MGFYDFQEDYVEYSKHGNVIKGQERAKVKSKYQEDIYNNNHTVSNRKIQIFRALCFVFQRARATRHFLIGKGHPMRKL